MAQRSPCLAGSSALEGRGAISEGRHYVIGRGSKRQESFGRSTEDPPAGILGSRMPIRREGPRRIADGHRRPDRPVSGGQLLPGHHDGPPDDPEPESLRLGDFTAEDVKALYRQHTEATGQAFSPGALSLAWHLTQGQPWLVNALAYEVCFRTPQGRDRARAVTEDMIQAAKESLIEKREAHLDQLADKLREERVRRVVESMLSGAGMNPQASLDDTE